MASENADLYNELFGEGPVDDNDIEWRVPESEEEIQEMMRLVEETQA